ncbi:MAG: MFS transporter [Thermoplasmata archaeon]
MPAEDLNEIPTPSGIKTVRHSEPTAKKPVTAGAIYSLLAMGLYQFAESMLYPTLAPEILHLSSDYLLVGLIYALPQLCSVLFAFLWGYISDRRKTRLGVLRPLLFAGTLLFLVYPFASPWILILLRTLQMAFFSGIILLNALLSEKFPEKKGYAIGVLAMVGAVGSTLGAWSSGFILTYFRSYFFFVCLGFDLAAFIFLYLSTEEDAAILSSQDTENGRINDRNSSDTISASPVKDGEQYGEKDTLKESKFIPFSRNNNLWLLALSAFFLGLADWIVFSLFSVYIDHLVLNSIGAGWVERLRGLIIGSAGVSGIVFSLLTGKWIDKKGRKTTLLITIASYFIMWEALGIFDNLIVALIVWLTPFWWVFNICTSTMAADFTTPKERGRGMALITTLNGFGAVTGAVLAGVLKARLDYPTVFIIAGIFTIPSFIAALFVKSKNGRSENAKENKTSKKTLTH